jgi:2-keto-4-pentenoate hydratase/2-oxohepta-3-ene-1,7-dioic acid hydratase in catechol pathway
MRLCSFQVEGEPRYGIANRDGGIVSLTDKIGDRYPTLLRLIEAGAIAEAAPFAESGAADFQETDVDFLPLYEEQVAVYCVGLNYAAHTAEANMAQPDFPRTFFKTRAALVGHGEDFEMPTMSEQFDFEGELAVVIGRGARSVSAADAMDYVLGYSCFMDGSVRDYQMERTVNQGKNFEKSSSMGPYLVTADAVGDVLPLTLETRVNGTRMQHTTFDKMIFSIPTTIEYLSHICRLNPGDVIATGTPEGVGFKRSPPQFLKKGDTVEVEIERVGLLSNTVA